MTPKPSSRGRPRPRFSAHTVPVVRAAQRAAHVSQLLDELAVEDARPVTPPAQRRQVQIDLPVDLLRDIQAAVRLSRPHANGAALSHFIEDALRRALADIRAGR